MALANTEVIGSTLLAVLGARHAQALVKGSFLANERIRLKYKLPRLAMSDG